MTKRKILLLGFLPLFIFLLITLSFLLLNLFTIKTPYGTLTDGSLADLSEEGEGYIMIKDNIFYQNGFPGEGSGRKIYLLNVDLKSFQMLNYRYGKDKYHVYHDGKTIQEADSNTFKIMYGGYAEDKSYKYFNGNKIGETKTLNPLKN